MHTVATLDPPGCDRSENMDLDSIQRAIDHATHLLPAQGPITAFVHHNTLHAFEDLDFDAAVRKGSRLFGCHPYLSEKHYRDFLTAGRIRDQDIDAELIDQLQDRAGDMLGFLGTRFSLYRAILRHTLHDGPSVDLRWVIGDTNALNKFREDTDGVVKKQFIEDTRQWVMRELVKLPHDDSVGRSSAIRQSIPAELRNRYLRLFEIFDQKKIENWSAETWESFVLHLLWNTCEFGASQSPLAGVDEPTARLVRHRDLLQEWTGQDADELVHEMLIPFCAAFLDQGFSNWPLANRDQGFLASFTALYAGGPGMVQPWRRGLAKELQSHRQQNLSALESIQQSLLTLGVTAAELNGFVNQTLLALRGFAGMLWQMETRGDRVNRGMPPGTLTEFLAARLLLDRMSASYIARTETGFGGELSELRPWLHRQGVTPAAKNSNGSLRNAYRLFELAQLLNWKPRILARNLPAEWQRILMELNQFSGIDRRQIYHLAYERKYRQETLDAVAAHVRRTVGGIAQKTCHTACLSTIVLH